MALMSERSSTTTEIASANSYLCGPRFVAASMAPVSVCANASKYATISCFTSLVDAPTMAPISAMASGLAATACTQPHKWARVYRHIL